MTETRSSVMTVDAFLEGMGSKDPTPGGGAAAAVAGATGAALISMVARLTQGKAGFEDLQERMDVMVERADRARAEYGAVTLASRLMASVGSELSVTVVGVGRLTGTLLRVSTGWLLLGAGGSEWVVPLAAVSSVGGASPRSSPAPPSSRGGSPAAVTASACSRRTSTRSSSSSRS